MKECCLKSDIRKDIANYVCINCGQTSGQIFCYFQSYNLNCNDYRKKKAIHSRTRWFRNMLMDYVHSDKDRDLLNADFKCLARCCEKYNLLNGRNLSVYGYYIRKLADRRGITLTKIPRGIKIEKTRKIFDERFRTACKLLGWGKIISSNSMEQTPEELHQRSKKEFKKYIKKLNQEELRAKKTGDWRRYARMKPDPSPHPNSFKELAYLYPHHDSTEPTPEEFERNSKKEFEKFMRKLRREEIRAEKTGDWKRYERMMPDPSFCPDMYSYDVLYHIWLFH